MPHLFSACLLLSLVSLTAASAQQITPDRLAMVTPPAAAPTPAAPAPAPVERIIQGQVLNEDGQPLPGATVILQSNKQIYISNADGYFTFASKLPRETVEVSMAGYSAARLQLRPETPGAVTLELLPGTRIKRTGRHAGRIVAVGQ